MDTALLTTPTAVLARVRQVRAVVAPGEVELLQLAVEWAHSHPDLSEAADRPDPADDPHHDPLRPGHGLGRRPPRSPPRSAAPPRPGRPSSATASCCATDCPELWARVRAGQVEAWRARRIAQAVLGAPADVAAHLDTTVARPSPTRSAR